MYATRQDPFEIRFNLAVRIAKNRFKKTSPVFNLKSFGCPTAWFVSIRYKVSDSDGNKFGVGVKTL